jgi:hypothetical protein
MSLNLKFYTHMEYDGKNIYDFFRFFMNFISSYTQNTFP